MGDSRVYLSRNRELRQLSDDHVINEGPLKHVLSRAIGLTPEIEPHCFEIQGNMERISPQRRVFPQVFHTGELHHSLLRDGVHRSAESREKPHPRGFATQGLTCFKSVLKFSVPRGLAV